MYIAEFIHTHCGQYLTIIDIATEFFDIHIVTSCVMNVDGGRHCPKGEVVVDELCV